MSGFKNIGIGQSLNFRFGRKDEKSIDGWTCVIEVRKQPGDAADIGPRTITKRENEKFVGFLTQTETAGLTVGDYILAARLNNASTDQEEHPYIRFKVGTEWI